jgi:hypothetical protein
MPSFCFRNKTASPIHGDGIAELLFVAALARFPAAKTCWHGWCC